MVEDSHFEWKTSIPGRHLPHTVNIEYDQQFLLCWYSRWAVSLSIHYQKSSDRSGIVSLKWRSRKQKATYCSEGATRNSEQGHCVHFRFRRTSPPHLWGVCYYTSESHRFLLHLLLRDHLHLAKMKSCPTRYIWGREYYRSDELCYSRPRLSDYSSNQKCKPYRLNATKTYLQRGSLEEVLSAHKEVELTKGFSTNLLLRWDRVQ